jgi:hypothetical protein
MLGGKGRGHPFDAPVDYDQLLTDTRAQRQLGPSGMRNAAAALSRFVDKPLEVSPVQLGFAHTIPPGPIAPALDKVPSDLDPPQVTVGL